MTSPADNSSPHARPARLARLAAVGILVNLALSGVKMAAGVLGNSYALIADAVESLVDVFGSALIWLGLKYGGRPADEDHPYGHGRAESLVALAVSALVFGAGVAIAVEAVREIMTPHHSPAWYTLVVLVAVVGVKEGLARVVAREAVREGSSAGSADAGHHRSDAITSAAAFVGIAIALIGGAGWEPADDWAALVASAVVMFNGLRLGAGPLNELLDRQDPAWIARVQGLASGVEGVRNVHKVRMRKVGTGWFVDMHVWVDGTMDVRSAHALSHRVKDAVRRAEPRVIDVLIHLEPAREDRPPTDPGRAGKRVDSGGPMS